MTLTEISYYSRKFAPFALLLFLIFLIFYYLIRIVFLTISPPKESTIVLNPIFGKINRPLIKDATASSGLDFTIDTIEGRPITATESAKVNFLPPTTARFGYRERIYLIAKALGFDTETIKHTLIGKEAEFRDDQQSLQIDITNLNFTYEYSFENNPQIFQEAIIPQENMSKTTAISFLTEIGRYPTELAQGKINTIFISYLSGQRQMKVLGSNKDANMV